VNAGYKNVNWMRGGIKGWQKALYATESDSKVLMALMDLNQSDPATWTIEKNQFQSLKNPTFLDLRSPDQFAQGHVEGAINIPYADLWTFDNLEKLNKSRDIVIIFDNSVVAGAFALTLRLLDYQAFILK
jgi:rhodanese-related sulfurtransferase